MCGSESFLFITNVEGTELKLCKRCAKYGKVLRKAKPVIQKEAPVQVREKKPVDEIEEMIVEDFALKIKVARERQDIKQEDFAKKINEKESVIHHLETGKMEPSIKLARKIEGFLGIKLVEEVKFQDYRSFEKQTNSNTLTLGDVIKIKKR